MDSQEQPFQSSNGHTAPSPWAAPPAPPPEPVLRGSALPIAGRGPLAIVEALLKSPASVLHEVQQGRGIVFGLAAIVAGTMVATGLGIATFGGGWQLVLVPLKLTLGAFLCAIICLPSLHVFSCLAGAQQSMRETLGALLMGIALMGVLLVGFAPVAWVFSQATSSAAFMGALHLAFLVVSCVLGLGLVSRALAALNGAPVRGTRAWGILFVLVLFQMTTTLRPLVGAWDGLLSHERMFFLEHWSRALAG